MRPSGWVLVVALLVAPMAGADEAKARASFKRGTAAFLLNQFDEAIREFEAGFKEEPQAAFLYNIAQAHARSGRKAQALEFYRKYLDQIPDDARDRAEVERQVRALESAATSTAVAPPEVIAPPATLVPAAPVTPRAATRRRPWVWAVVAVGAGVVIGAAVGIGVGVSQPVDAPEHRGTEMTATVTW